ncbi:ferrochelatase [Brevibacillus marinus]|uniref:ferrochelatase n=1 Tax=Brevibacillus marinus TaxID=2496837 RepID=UPI000F821389|nr:ferrochelatase [Brevibacillus marinus]
MAKAVAAAANIARYQAVFRSGRGDGWLGPDVKEAMKALAAKGAKGFVMCELLSVTADVESYQEIKEECQAVARELDVEFAVAEFLGDSFDTVLSITELIKSRL